MKQFKLLIILSLLMSSCIQKKSAKSFDKQDSFRVVNSHFSKKPIKYYYNYDSLISNIENFDKGYIDTFSIRGTQFRLFSNPDSLGDLELQVLKNGLWQTNIKIPYGIGGYSADYDINNDGFSDFQNFLLRGSEVYLFDTTQKKFYLEPISLAFEWTLIDSVQKLYSNNYDIKGIYETNLFKLDGFKQTFLYNAPIKYEISDKKDIATVRLYKVINNDISDTLFISEQKYNLLEIDFDYKQYWKSVISNKSSNNN